MLRHRVTLVAVTAAAAVTLAACGGGGSSSGGSADTSTQLTGTPYVVEVITGLTSVSPATEGVDAAKAAAAAINASGGINGHPVEVKSCDTGQNPGQSVTCARELVQDRTILASVGHFDVGADQANAVLQQAGVPNIGPSASGASILSSDNSFPIAGFAGAGLAIPLADAGAKTIQVAYVDSPQAAAVVQFAKSTLAATHPDVKVLDGIPVPITATDVSSYVNKAADADAVALAMSPNLISAWLTAAKAGGYTQKLAATSSALRPKDLQTYGANAEGLLVVGGQPFSSSPMPGMQQFRDEMAKTSPDAQLDEIAVNSWMGTWAFAQVARGIQGDVTRQNLLQALQTNSNLDVFGLLPTGFSFTKPFPQPALSRLFNRSVVEGVVKNGTIEQTSQGWVPVFPNT
jgi:branched-chain amino acid transport system substrate-binding protein